MSGPWDPGAFSKLCNRYSLSSEQASLDLKRNGLYSGELQKIIRSQNKFILGSNPKLPENVKKGSCILVELPDRKQEGFLVDKWERMTENPFRAVITLQGDPGLDGNARAGTLQRLTYPRKVFPPLTYTGIRWYLPDHVHIKRDKNGEFKSIAQ